MRGLYVHIPFCARKCDYCDFYSLTVSPDIRTSYRTAVLNEAKKYPGMAFRTVFFGGGTPSILGTELVSLIRDLGKILDLSRVEEATVEVNPESSTAELLESLKIAGINRISIGVQSLDDNELKKVGRLHTATRALDTVTLAQNTGFDSVSVDLMIGLPGQTWMTLYRTLDTLVHAGIDHLSLYCLSLEDGTPLADDPPRDLPSDDMQAELFQCARSFLMDHGFRHYEISNFSREEHECRHNLIYWHGEEYLGLGPAAASYLDGKRFNNRADLFRYLDDPQNQIENMEDLPPGEKAAEEAMLRLRLIDEGLDIMQLSTKYGADTITDLAARLERMADRGTLVVDGSAYRLPSDRILTSNPVFSEILGKQTDE